MLKYEELPAINSERWLSLEDFEGEEWRDIDVAKGLFMISNYGRVKALARERANHYSKVVCKEKIRRLGYSMKGYPMIQLTDKCKSVFTGFIHKLVAMAFIPNVEKKPQIDHINTIKTDNRVCNLRWVTNKENASNPITAKRVRNARARQIGTKRTDETKHKLSEQKKGEKNPFWGVTGKDHHLSIPVIQLTLSGIYVREWECIREPSKIYGFHISDCCRGKRKQCGGYKWEYKYLNV